MKNLGVIFDTTLKFDKQINSVLKIQPLSTQDHCENQTLSISLELKMLQPGNKPELKRETTSLGRQDFSS